MEWLIAHEDELNNEVPASNTSPNKVVDANAAPEPTPSGGEDAKGSDPNETADNMAVRKKITVEEAQRIITERQAKRAEEERKKEIEDEKKRRVFGQKMAETRAELQDQERINLAQQIRREKVEKELHKKQVLEQIARDREAMRLKNSKPASSSQPQSSSTSKPDPNKTAAKECKIALRFPDGSNLVHQFSPREQLSAVRLFVQMTKKTSDDIEFVAPPNKKLTKSLMDETLESLGLCPASRLEVKFYTAAFTPELDWFNRINFWQYIKIFEIIEDCLSKFHLWHRAHAMHFGDHAAQLSPLLVPMWIS